MFFNNTQIRRIIHVRVLMDWTIENGKTVDDLIIIPVEEKLRPFVEFQLEKLIEEKIKEEKLNRGDFYLFKLLISPQQVEIYYQDKMILGFALPN